MRSIPIIAVIAILLAFSCALPTTKIIGGENVAEGELPYVININILSFNLTLCGGALVVARGKQFVVSLATCVQHYRDPGYPPPKLIAGDLNLLQATGHEQIRIANRYILHPEYDWYTKQNDIVIIGYAEPFELSDYVQPIALPSQGQVTTGNVLISGWGGVTDDEWSEANQLQKFQLPLISDEECAQLYGASLDFHPVSSMMCAQSPNGGNAHCETDRGGPVVAVDGGYLAGVMAWPQSCLSNEKGFPDVYIEVSHYVDWILTMADDL